jgi:hypothetical protein
VKGVKHLEDALRSVLADINAAAEDFAGRIEDDEFDLFVIGDKRDAIHQLAKHVFVQEVVLRTIQGQAGHAGIEAKLDMLKFLGVAAFGYCTNFHGRTTFHDGYLLTGSPGSGAEFDASTPCRAEPTAFEKECAMSLLVIRPVRKRMTVSGLERTLTGTARAEELSALFRPFSLYTQSRQSI